MDFLQYFSEDFLATAFGTVVMLLAVAVGVFWNTIKEEKDE